MPDEFEASTEFLKFDEELGLVFGFAIISKVNGEPFFDVQGDHIPEDAMLKAATDFMENSRMAGEMHTRDEEDNPIVKGSIVFAWPMTTEIAKAFEMETSRTGLMIAMKPEDDDVLQKFKRGDFTGFSIGGLRGEDEEVEDEDEDDDA